MAVPALGLSKGLPRMNLLGDTRPDRKLTRSEKGRGSVPFLERRGLSVAAGERAELDWARGKGPKTAGPFRTDSGAVATPRQDSALT